MGTEKEPESISGRDIHEPLEPLLRGVRQRENGNWVVERVINGKRRPKTVKTREEAIRLRREYEMGLGREEDALAVSALPPEVAAHLDRQELPRGVRRRENGNWVVERYVNGRRCPKTVKTRAEAIRLWKAERERAGREQAERERGKTKLDRALLGELIWPDDGPLKQRRMPRTLLQLENGIWVVLGRNGQLQTTEWTPPAQSERSSIPNSWTLANAFQAAFETPTREGGFLGPRSHVTEARASAIRKYFGDDFPVEDIRRATKNDDEHAQTLDGLVEALCRDRELDLSLDKDRSINKVLGTLGKTLKLAVKTGKLAKVPEFPTCSPDDVGELRFSLDDGCFRILWQRLGVRADANFMTQIERDRGCLELAPIVALLRNINERLKRLERALGLPQLD